MKKRLLITSIVMMLVVAVALSTATYAWFTSNASVTSSAVTLTAASNNAASLGIGWTATGSFGPSITPESPAADNPATEETDEGVYFAPALPNQLTVGTTNIHKSGEPNANEIAFETEFATPNASGDMVFLGNGSSTTPYNWNNGTEQSFFIKNLSPASTISTVTLTATISGDASALLRVGVFKFDSTSGTYKLLGVLANQASATYTAVEANTTLNGTYYKKYLGQYVSAVGGTQDDVDDGSADYVTDATSTADSGLYIRSVETINHAEVAYGNIVQNASVNAMTTTYCVESITVATGLAALATEEFKVLVWEDAVALGDTEQGFVGTVALTFTAGAAAVPQA